MTLTEAAFWTKKLSVIGIVVVALIAVVVLIFIVPPPPPPPEYQTPNYACTEKAQDFMGEALTIPSYELSPDSNPVYVINTDTGKLDDNLPDIINVYKYEDLGQSINSQAEAKILATKMGFEKEAIERQLTTEYIWQDNSSQRGLRINARDLNFTFSTNVSKIRSIRANADLPSEGEAISIAKKTLNGLGLYLRGFDEVAPLTYLIDINNNGTYSQADSLRNAELIRVDFLRKFSMITIPSNIKGADRMVDSLERRKMEAVIDEKTVNDQTIQIYNFKTFMTHQISSKSNVSVYVGPVNEEFKTLKNVYQIDYKVWDIGEESCGTYPLIGAGNAQQKIQNGEGSLVFLNYNDDEVAPYTAQDVKQFVVTSVTLTYYEGLLEQEFLQPVYYFSGQAELANGTKADFDMYYPAINYAILEDKKILEPAPVDTGGSMLPF